MRRVRMALPGAIILVALSVAFSAAGEQTAPNYGEMVTIELKDVRFHPARLEVPVGTVVRFVNRDPFEHDIVNATPDGLADMELDHSGHHGHEDGHDDHEPEAVGHGFHSPHLNEGEEWIVIFNEPGTYPILCTVGGHYLAGMVGEIVVTE